MHYRMNLPIPFLKTEEDVYYKAGTIYEKGSVSMYLKMKSIYDDKKVTTGSCCAAGTGRPLAN